MKYRVFLLTGAQRELARLPVVDYTRMKASILALADDPRPPGCKKLVGREGWRIKQGDYRASVSKGPKKVIKKNDVSSAIQSSDLRHKIKTPKPM